jgi:hypothetical protein
MKKIISFSLWGDKDKYIVGAFENIKLQQKYFPNWICRFYIDKNLPSYIYHKLKKLGAEVIDMDENPNTPLRLGMFWRFKVLEDNDVERFIIRDTDSRIDLRDYSVVKDWLLSKKPFHIIRDHIYHSTKIMGGMWGATNEIKKIINYTELYNKFIDENKNNTKFIYGPDQDFLAKYIYPKVKELALIHDNWDRYKEGAKQIPHLNKSDEYIGKSIEL